MSDFLNRIRSGAGKAAFEADKMRRIQAIQLKIRSLNQEAEKEHNKVGKVAYALYQKDQINQPELKAACDQLAAVFAQIAAHEQEIEHIREEAFVDPAIAVQYGHICPNGHGQIPQQDKFCQVCGAKAIDVSPPSGSACPNCQELLPLEAQFCANCGQAVPAPVVEEITGDTCPNCDAPLLVDAVFCTECGHKLSVPETDLKAMDEAEPETAVPQSVELEAKTEEPNEAEATMMAEETDVSDDLEPEENSMPEPMSTCPVCEAALVEGAAFCTECGYRLEGGDNE